MPIAPTPKLGSIPVAGVPDLWENATFYDVTLVMMVQALLNSGLYAPGPLLMGVALAATEQLMVETGRWDGAPTFMTQEEAQAQWKGFRISKK